MNTACWLVNRLPSPTIDWKTLEETWSGKFVDYIGLRVFDCPAYACVSDGASQPRARSCIFLGYVHGVKGYRLWCTEKDSSDFTFSRDVTFDEYALFQKRSEGSIGKKDLDGV